MGDYALRLLNRSAAQQVLRRLDSAGRQLRTGARGKWRVRMSSLINSLDYQPDDGASLKSNRLYVQNAELIKVGWHRELSEGKLKSIIDLGKLSVWWVLLQIDIADRVFEQSANPMVGVDNGFSPVLALSERTAVDRSQYLHSLAPQAAHPKTFSIQPEEGWQKQVHGCREGCLAG